MLCVSSSCFYFCIFLILFINFFFFCFSFKTFKFALNLFLFSYFLTGQIVENAHLDHKNLHTCAFIWENVLAFRDTTGFAEHAFWLGVVFKPVKPNILEVWMGLPGCGRRRFLFLCRLLRLIRRGWRRHRLCIISQVRFVGLTFFRNAAFEERTLRHFEQVMISSILSSFKTSCKITCYVLILTSSRNKRQSYVISWAREIILVGFFF